MEFNNVTDIILLVSAVGLALMNIVQIYIYKPYTFFKNKKIEDKQKRKEELTEMLNEIVPQSLDSRLSELRTNQEDLKQQMAQFTTNTITMMRQDITSIYYKYKDEKQLPLYVYENLKELYSNYESTGGNHYIHKIYDRMMHWEVIDTEDAE